MHSMRLNTRPSLVAGGIRAEAFLPALGGDVVCVHVEERVDAVAPRERLFADAQVLKSLELLGVRVLRDEECLADTREEGKGVRLSLKVSEAGHKETKGCGGSGHANRAQQLLLKGHPVRFVVGA